MGTQGRGRGCERPVFQGDGRGGFAAPTDRHVSRLPGSRLPGGESAALDLTGDGLPDVVVVDLSTRRLILLVNDGSGGFEEAVDFPLDGGYSFDAEDLDGDGAVDVVAPGPSSRSIVLLRGDPGGGGRRPRSAG